jgi:SAM-dependent methyltransferase
LSSTPLAASAPREDRIKHFLGRYLEVAPVAVALFRASEAVAFSAVSLPGPILDVGCGFGEFGRLLFEGRARPDVGLDIDAEELRRAQEDATYKTLMRADARTLPFADASFASVISVSTLEHIPNVSGFFPEIARVLQPGGLLAFSVPIRDLNRNLAGHRVLRIGSEGAANRYARLVHRSLTHVNVWDAAKWADLANSSGLTVEETRRLLSPAATMTFEGLLPAAFANRLFRVVTGRRPPHPKPFVRALTRLLYPLVANEGPEGSNLFVVARKPAA